MGPEELTTSGDIDMRRLKEVAVDGERDGRHHDMQMREPVEGIPRRLDRHDRAGESPPPVSARMYALTDFHAHRASFGSNERR